MGLLDSIKGYYNKVVNTVSNVVNTVVDTVTGADKPEKKPNSVFKSENKQKIGDSVEINQKRKTQPKNDANTNIRALKSTLDDGCKRNNIDSGRVYNCLLAKLGLKNMNDFYTKLTKEKQQMYLAIVGESVDFAEKCRASQNKDIDVTEAVICDIELKLDAINKKIFSNKTEMDKALNGDKSVDRAIDKINNAKGEDVAAALEELDSQFDEEMEAEYARIAKIRDPKNRRIEMAKAEQAIRIKRLQAHHRISMKGKTERAVETVTIVDSNDLPKAAKNIYRTRRTAQERAKAAGMFDYSRNEVIAKHYYTKGTPVKANVYRDFTAENISHMTNGDRQKFENDYISARQGYQENGYPEYMQEDLLTATASGIAAGTYVNEFMSESERTSALVSFYKKEQEYFGDLEQVKADAAVQIERYIQENQISRPQLAKEVQNVKEKVEDAFRYIVKVNKTDNTKPEQAKTGKDLHEEIGFKNISAAITIPIRKEDAKKYGIKEEQKAETVLKQEENKTQISFEYQITKQLQEGKCEVSNVAKEHKVSVQTVYKIMSKSSTLLSTYDDDFKNYVARQSKINTLLDLANCAKARMIIVHHNRVDNKSELYDKLESKSSSFERKILEKEKEQNGII